MNAAAAAALLGRPPKCVRDNLTADVFFFFCIFIKSKTAGTQLLVLIVVCFVAKGPKRGGSGTRRVYISTSPVFFFVSKCLGCSCEMGYNY